MSFTLDQTTLRGKVALVTGASRRQGIGRACALTLARLGAHVGVTGTDRSVESFPQDEQRTGWQGAESVAQEVNDWSREAIALSVDIRDATAVRNMVEKNRW